MIAPFWILRCSSLRSVRGGLRFWINGSETLVTKYFLKYNIQGVHNRQSLVLLRTFIPTTEATVYTHLLSDTKIVHLVLCQD